jgi:cytoskeleton protein RodZ
MASELHLTRRIVEALEADDYADIEARVFVRGYLRNYARVVGVPTESILRQFDERWPDESTPQSMVKPAPQLPADGGPGRGWSGAVTWLLIVGSLVLFLVWWRGYPGGETTPVSGEMAGSGSAQRAVAAATAPRPADAPPLAAADGSLPLPAPQGDGAATAGEAEVPATTGEAVTAGAGATPKPAPSALLAALEAPADSAPPAAPAPKEIVMTFSAPCWVDVRDSEREFKLFGEMPKGARKVLGGTPPYRLVIGNAAAVDILIDGESFDLEPYAKGNVARFMLHP